MATDDLSAPLGQNRAPRRRRLTLPLVIPQAVVGLLGLFVVFLAGWAMHRGRAVRRRADGDGGGRPHRGQVRRQARRGRPACLLSQAANAGPRRPPAPPPGSKTVTIIDGISGKRQEITIRPPCCRIARRQRHQVRRRHRSTARRDVAARPASQGGADGTRAVRRLCPPGQGASRQAECAARSRSWSAGSASARAAPPTRSASCRDR